MLKLQRAGMVSTKRLLAHVHLIYLLLLPQVLVTFAWQVSQELTSNGMKLKLRIIRRYRHHHQF